MFPFVNRLDPGIVCVRIHDGALVLVVPGLALAAEFVLPARRVAARAATVAPASGTGPADPLACVVEGCAFVDERVAGHLKGGLLLRGGHVCSLPHSGCKVKTPRSYAQRGVLGRRGEPVHAFPWRGKETL